MGTNQIRYYIREGFRSIFSHGLMSFAATCMIVACLLIMGSFSLIAVNVDHMLSDLEDDNEFLAYVDESLPAEQVQAIGDQLKGLPNIAEVTFMSKAEAMDAFQEKHEEMEGLLEDLPDSVLRDRYRIHVVDIELMKDTVAMVEKIEGIAKTNAALDVANGFVMLRNVITVVAIVLVIMLVTISLFIIANTIKLATFTRREEIAIMKMCGATNWFIRWPFIVEGILLGLFGALVAFGLEWGMYELIRHAIAGAGNLKFIDMMEFSRLSRNILLSFLGAGFAIGAGGSVLAIRKFLKV